MVNCARDNPIGRMPDLNPIDECSPSRTLLLKDNLCTIEAVTEAIRKLLDESTAQECSTKRVNPGYGSSLGSRLKAIDRISPASMNLGPPSTTKPHAICSGSSWSLGHKRSVTAQEID